MPSSVRSEDPRLVESVRNSTILSEREICRLSRDISAKWLELALMLNIPSHQIENLVVNLAYPQVTDKAARTLELYNTISGFTREELGQCLEELNLLGLKQKVMNGEYR